MERLVRILKIAILMASVSMLVAKPLRSTAQTNTGTIRGNVTDAQGAKISGASVLLVNSATSVARTSATNSSGDYLFVALDPSTYSLRIEAPEVCLRRPQEHNGADWPHPYRGPAVEDEQH